MASETPQQRPQRRDDAEPSTGPARGRARSGAGGAGGDGTSPEHGRVPRRSAVAATRGFVEESVAELKKVDWPTQPQVIQGTGVVLFACLVVGLFLYVSDQAFKHLVENVFLGQ